MDTRNGVANSIMVVGQDQLAYSVACSLLDGDHPVLLLTDDRGAAEHYVRKEVHDCTKLAVITDWPKNITARLVILVTPDKLLAKQHLISQVENRTAEDTIIAVNTECIGLEEIQTDSTRPTRIFGLNWSYPVHRTFFAEIISNAETDPATLAQLEKWVNVYGKKDACTVRNGFSIRARMMAAMLREGLYLVENGFASIESVDRACRNDAGFYLSFVGNFRYMDLMGTYAYGMVMKDLNRELSNMVTLPKILQEKKDKGETGMAKGKGFYTYSVEEKGYWDRIFRAFSQEIQQLIKKYPHESFDH
ncbi:3-hydroxyacyl-CoA dehydrogenase [Sphingobacterium sp. DN00404]|uniref:3-hydroxyacyl-CoA dehydrogenase n=1 Tax=Sphingobacterium micropteri TaxID=2763501 RepID=A0ABR7YNH6_9SPHI|nr:3-hydroxyacyl-CoA dehydrogenase NAD-binding domain-containing protein [Sphingobacterium micropteri]MBD1432890.1 3-hydroxyacyl-CoA dehydrogenase [Sphingobacterium micropteri]